MRSYPYCDAAITNINSGEHGDIITDDAHRIETTIETKDQNPVQRRMDSDHAAPSDATKNMQPRHYTSSTASAAVAAAYHKPLAGNSPDM